MNVRTSTWICLASAFWALAAGPWLAQGDDAQGGELPALSGNPPGPGNRPSIHDAIERARTTAKAVGDKTPAYWDALENGLRELRTRQPAEGEVYAELLSVAVRRSGEPSLKLAREILAWPAPETVKEKARGLVSLRESLGNPWSIQLPGIDGRRVNSRDRIGNVVLIHFWASWCAPCREELRLLKALQVSRQSKGLEILGVNFDESPKALRRFVARDSISWPQHCAVGGLEGPVARQFGVTSLPMLWLIDRDGRLRDLNAGEDLEAKVDRCLSEPVPTPATVTSPREPAKN